MGKRIIRTIQSKKTNEKDMEISAKVNFINCYEAIERGDFVHIMNSDNYIMKFDNFNLLLLAQETLAEFNITNYFYNLFAYSDDKVCLEFDAKSKKWELYYGCRTEKENLQYFPTVYDAIIGLFKRLAKSNQMIEDLMQRFVTKICQNSAPAPRDLVIPSVESSFGGVQVINPQSVFEDFAGYKRLYYRATTEIHSDGDDSNKKRK